MAIKLSAGVKNAVDTILGLGVAAFGYLVANAASFTGTWHGIPEADVAGLIGLAGGYFASDALTYVDTGAVPTASTIYTQSLSVLQQLRTLPNLTNQEQQTLDLAISVVKAKQSASA